MRRAKRQYQPPDPAKPPTYAALGSALATVTLPAFGASFAKQVGYRQLGHCSMSLTKNWFNLKTLYDGDKHTESIVLVNELLLTGKDTLALDVWLTDRTSEQGLLKAIAEQLLADRQFQPVAELVSALDHFPDHKLAITLRSARIRDLQSNELMFAEESA